MHQCTATCTSELVAGLTCASSHKPAKSPRVLSSKPYCDSKVSNSLPRVKSFESSYLLSCLYHTVKILAHRPVLSKNLPQATASGRSAIIECVSAASSITMVFELFIKTFGSSHCVMSLSYCIYMASSVFLLYIQASKPPDPKVIERLRFCIDALEKVSSTNAGRLVPSIYIPLR